MRQRRPLTVDRWPFTVDHWSFIIHHLSLSILGSVQVLLPYLCPFGAGCWFKVCPGFTIAFGSVRDFAGPGSKTEKHEKVLALLSGPWFEWVSWSLIPTRKKIKRIMRFCWKITDCCLTWSRMSLMSKVRGWIHQQNTRYLSVLVVYLNSLAAIQAGSRTLPSTVQICHLLLGSTWSSKNFLLKLGLLTCI